MGNEANKNENYNRDTNDFHYEKNINTLENGQLTLGIKLIKQGDFVNAEPLLEEEYNKNKKADKNIIALGIIKLALKKTKEALELFKKAESNNNKEMKYEFIKGIAGCYFQFGIYYDTIRELKKIFIGTYSKNAIKDKDCLRYLLISFNKMGKYNKTLNKIEKFNLENSPEFENEFFWMEEKAEALYNLKKYLLCKDFCTKLLKKHEYLNYYLAKCCFKLKITNEAKEIIERVINKYPNAPEPLYLLAKIEEELHLDDRKIIKDYQNCIKKDPYNIKYYIELIIKYFDYCNLESALKVIEFADKHIDKEYQLKYNLLYLLYKTECYCRLKRRAEANKILVFVRNTLRNKKIKNKFNQVELIEIFSRYFEIYHECKYLYSSDLVIDRNRLLGQGGYGKVYAGKLKEKEVAIKEFCFKTTFNKNIEYTFTSLESVFMEISALELLSTDCKYILPVESIFYESNRKHLMLITPLMKGGNFDTLIKDKSIKLNGKAMVDILLQIAYSIKHFQSFDPPFVHHDIKPSNVLLEEKYNPERNKVFLCDFGMIQEVGVVCKGFTPAYAAPELISDEDYGCPVDIFSFGMLMWETFSREIPFQGMNIPDILEKISKGERVEMDKLKKFTPKGIKELIIKCFEQNPKKRPKIDDIISKLKGINKNLEIVYDN